MNHSFIRLVASLIVLLVGGAMFAEWLIDQADREMRGTLVDQAQRLARATNQEQLAALAAAPSDTQRPEYRRVKSQLVAVRSLYPTCRFIHLTTRQADGSIVFVVDSEAADAENSSLPAQIYSPATSHLHHIFETGIASAEGPLPDRFGLWISALVPILDSQTGARTAVLGMDVDGRDWNWKLVRAALPAAALTFALVTVLLAGAWVRHRRSRHPGSPSGRMRHLEAILAMAVGLAFSVLAGWQVFANVSQREHAGFESFADQQAGAILDKLESVRDLQLDALSQFYAARENILDEEFAEFAKALTKNASITTWGWIPVVPAAEKEQFEARARSSGKATFTLWQRDAEGKRVPASERDPYYPIFQVAPRVRNAPLVGYDSGSEPRRQQALVEAAATGLTTGTDPVTLSSETEQQKGIVIYRPVYTRDGSRRLRGFVGCSVRMEQLLRAGTAPEKVAPLEISLLHRNASPELLASTWDAARTPRDNRTAFRPLFAFGKVFTITVHPTPELALANQQPLRAGGLTFFLGLVLTGTIGTIVHLMVRQREKLEQRVAGRTSELRESEVSYRNQFVKNSVVMLLLDPKDGAIVDANTAAVHFYGYAREELLRMRITDINTRSPSEVRQIIDSVMRGQCNRFGFEHRLASGARRDVAVSLSAIQYAGRTVLHSIVQDITDQKRAQEALRESAERYRSIISVSNTGAWEYRSDTSYLWCSAEYFSMLGLNPADFDLSGKANLEETWIALLHPDDRRSAVDHFFAYLANGSKGTYENYFRLRHRNGEWIWIWSRGQTLRDASGKMTHLTVGTHIDTTERRRAALELEQANHNLTERIKELRCLYAISKLTTENTGPVVEVFRAAIELIPPGWQYPETARARITYAGLVFASPGFTITPWRQSADIVVAGAVVGQIEVCYLEECPAGTEGPFLADERTLLLSIAAQFGVMIERRHAEEKLWQLSSTIEQAPLSVIITDLTGKIEYVNPKCCALTGYHREELIGQNARIFKTSEVPPEVYQELWQAIAGNRVWTGELKNRKKNGDLLLETLVVAPLVDRSGQVTHYVALKDDITAQKRFEAETTAMLAKEREVSEMKSQFISVASHEFRTPLAAALGSLELLDHHADRLTEAKRTELIVRTQRSLGRLTVIMDDVLHLSRAESGRIKVQRMTVDLGQFVRDVVHELAEGDRNRHVFAFQQLGRTAAVPADTHLLHHILSNLVGNSARYSPPGTEVSLTLTLDENAYSLTVADEGIGVPEAERERIFEPFVRGSNVGQIGGTGLGLNIVKRYTELMGGCIEVLPSKKGATFRVGIPYHQPLQSK